MLGSDSVKLGHYRIMIFLPLAPVSTLPWHGRLTTTKPKPAAVRRGAREVTLGLAAVRGGLGAVVLVRGAVVGSVYRRSPVA